MCETIEELAEFREQFLNDILSYSNSESIFNEEGFLKLSIDKIFEEGDKYEPIEVSHNKIPTKIHAYAYGDADGVLSIFTSNFMHLEGEWTVPQNRGDVIKIVERGKRFIEKSMKDVFTSDMEPTGSDFSAAKNIRGLMNGNLVTSISLYYLTDGLLSERTKNYSVEKINNINVFVKPYDIKSLCEMFESDSGQEDFTIDFDEVCDGLIALSTNLTGLQSFLAVMPATVLEEIYSVHGQTLLKSNVRNFLNFTNKKNQKMRETMAYEPEKFFAYNNGLTVTATDIEFEKLDSAIKIKKLTNLNIVNGGQTTCSIFFAPRDKSWKYANSIDLSKVFVPMKLTVINSSKEEDEEAYEQAEDFRSDIAKYANFQTAVINADLQANDPFHVRLHNISKRLRTPPDVDGIQSYWFYERMKGQYNILKKLHKSGPKSFAKKFPTPQKITKEFMATLENTWRMMPHVVSGGAGNNLTVFYKNLEKEFKENEDRFRDPFYRAVISKRIISKEIAKIIGSSDWFQKETYLKPFVTHYTLSLILYKLRSNNQELNLNAVWDRQAITDSLRKQLDHTGKIVNMKFMDGSFTHNVAFREFARKETTWKKFKSVDPDLQHLEKIDILLASEVEDEEEETSKIGKVSGELESMETILKKSKNEWDALIQFQYEKGYIFGSPEISLPTLAANMQTSKKVPSEKQFKFLSKIINKAKREGFTYNEMLEKN